MSVYKQQLYNINGDVILPETVFEQVKENDSESASKLNSVIQVIQSDIEALKEHVEQANSASAVTETAIEEVKEDLKDYAETTYVNQKDTETLNSAKSYSDGKITYGTEDLEDGVSPLATGTLYVVISE